MQVARDLGQALEDFSPWLHLDAKAILRAMADTAKRARRPNALPRYGKSKTRKARPTPINTSLANDYEPLQHTAHVETDKVACITPSVYEMEDPFADQPSYQELPLPGINVRGC